MDHTTITLMATMTTAIFTIAAIAGFTGTGLGSSLDIYRLLIPRAQLVLEKKTAQAPAFEVQMLGVCESRDHRSYCKSCLSSKYSCEIPGPSTHQPKHLVPRASPGKPFRSYWALHPPEISRLLAE